MRNNKTDMQVLLRAKIKIYPEYVYRDKYVKGELKFRSNHWYLVVDNDGLFTMYPKAIGHGKILKGKDIIEAIDKTAAFWRQKIEQLKTKNGK